MSSEGKVLHFKLNQIEEENGVFYQFEGDLFASIPEIIMHHLVSKQPISITSQAVIKRYEWGTVGEI